VNPSQRIHSFLRLPALAGALAALLALQSASADTTIAASGTFTIDNSNTTTVGSTTTWNDTGTLTINNGGTLQTWPNQNGIVANNDAIVLAGSGGTYTLRFNDNDTKFTLNNPITSTATGAQTLAITLGNNGNGDRESVVVMSGIPDVGDSSAMSLTARFSTQTGSQSYLSLPGDNAFTGPITLTKGNNTQNAYLTIGGVKTKDGNTPGTGRLGSGNYPGAISLDTTTALYYDSSADQTLAGAISGAGSLIKDGSGTLTLSGANTYQGNTTISNGTLVLGPSGGLTFYVTDSATNKVTGSGTATLNGTFTINTSAVTAATGSWPLVDTTTKSFGGTFGLTDGVTAWGTPVGTVFTKVDGLRTWTFDTSTGVLSLTTAAVFTSFAYNGLAGIIDNVGWTVTLPVAYGTDLASVAPTYTTTGGAGCNQPNGGVPTPAFSGDPVHYVVGGVHDYLVTATVLPAPPGGVSGVAAWYDAAKGIITDGSGVSTWLDQSPNGHTATRTNGTLTLATNQVNGLPTVQFRNAAYANISGTLFAKEQYMVFKSPNGNSYNGDWGAVMGDVTDQHGYMMGNGTNFWGSNYPEAVSQNGTVLASPWNITNMGTFLILKIDGAYPDTTPRSYSLGNVYGNGSPQYHNVNLDVAEVIAYDHALSANDEAQVGLYLSNKYGMTTAYSPARMLSFSVAGGFGTIDQNALTINLSVPQGTDVTALAPTYTVSSGTGSPASGTTRDFTSAKTYTVTDGAANTTYTVTVSFFAGLNESTYLGPNSQSLLAPISNLMALTPSATGAQVNNIDYHTSGFAALPGSPGSSNFSILWEGWFDVLAAGGHGDYTFGTSSDDGSVIYMDLNGNGSFADAGEYIVNNNYYQGNTVRTGTVTLNMDSVHLVIGYYQGGGGYDMTAGFAKGTGVAWSSLNPINGTAGYFFPTDPHPPVTAGYASWATQHAGGQTAEKDYNNDGVQNGIAYFMGATGVATLPGIVNGQIAWPHDATATGITWKVLTSQDLQSWTDVTGTAVDAGGFVTYTLPKATPKLFVRLEVLAP